MRDKNRYLISTTSMLMVGIHINISMDNMDENSLDDIYQKIIYYTPFIIPYSFSSPFYNGKKFKGLCFRNYIRASTRQLTSKREINGNKYIEFLGYDTCGDRELLRGVISLLKGLILDKSLKGRAKRQDIKLVKLSCLYGFDNKFIKEEGLKVLNATIIALGEDSSNLNRLKRDIGDNKSYSKTIKNRFDKSNNIIKSISNLHNYD